MGASASKISLIIHKHIHTYIETHGPSTHLHTHRFKWSVQCILFQPSSFLSCFWPLPMGPMGVEARTESNKAVEGKICEYLSTLFKGLCFSSNNCKHTCRKEQFTRGHCSVFKRACVCTKKC